MLRYLDGDQLSDHPLLRDTMFRDRAAQFKTRLKWQVDVDENGIVTCQSSGSSAGVITTGTTSINELCYRAP